MFKEERNETQFEWSMLGDIAEGRPNLGSMVHVAVYRLMQFTLRDVLIKEFGVENADRIFSEAGKKAGEEYCNNVLTEKDHNFQKGWPEIEMGIALHTGEVVLGNIGSTKRSKYSVIGSSFFPLAPLLPWSV